VAARLTAWRGSAFSLSPSALGCQFSPPSRVQQVKRYQLYGLRDFPCVIRNLSPIARLTRPTSERQPQREALRPKCLGSSPSSTAAGGKGAASGQRARLQTPRLQTPRLKT
jgi:hypothetical protein